MKAVRKSLCLFALLLIRCVPAIAADTVLVEAESFADRGGWVIDTQSIDQMGSPYLLAHGLGVPVRDAATTIDVPSPGKYRVLVRTRDWVAPWKVSGSPGRFQLLVNGTPLEATFGTEGARWHWQDGGQIEVTGKRLSLVLHDLTGFDGRCDAILLTSDLTSVPPNAGSDMRSWRRKLLALADAIPDAGRFDLVVVGGGMAGCCAAVSGARLGLNVALVQNRPVLGGNNSSEVRVGLSGKIHQEPYPRLGDLVDEIGPIGYHNYHDALKDPNSPRSRYVLKVIEQDPRKRTHNAGPASNYEDDKKLRVVQAEKNLKLFLNAHAFQADKDGPRIKSVLVQDTTSGREFRVTGRWFVDSTGDGNLGFLAGADFRIGRESRDETGESLAPARPDQMTMGTSVQWDSVLGQKPSPFPDCPWAVSFDEKTCHRITRGDWDWETGMGLDQVAEIEHIRDYALRVVFGNWAYLKNRCDVKTRFANRRLAWVACIGGKRESRRLLGDVILQEQDLLTRKPYPDACVTTTWPIDLHYPDPKNSEHFPGREFLSVAKGPSIKPYPIPWRCLYSRNVPNLMMAGRNISVTHVALGTVRVQRTTGMMGEVVGMAASLCKKHNINPRGVYERYLEELKELMRRGAGKQAVTNDAAAGETTSPTTSAAVKPKTAAVALRAENFVVLPSSQPLAFVDVQCLQSQPYRGTVSYRGPQGWRVSPAQRQVELRPGEIQRVQFAVDRGTNLEENSYPVEIRAASSDATAEVVRKQNVRCASAPFFKPVIDGDPAEWKDAIPLRFVTKGKLTTVSTYWNRQQFCLLVAVEEDRFVGYRAKPGPNGFDAVQVAVAPQGSKTGSLPTDDAGRYEFLFVWTGAGTAGRCYQLARPNVKLGETQQDRELAPLACEQAVVAVSRKDRTTYYECAVPFAPMRQDIRPSEGREFHLSVLVHDPDGTGLRDLGEAVGLWPSQRNRFAWSRWQGAIWGVEPPFDNKLEWGLCASKY